jgi:hypothetical protein
MSSSAKREALARINGRYQRAGRLHKKIILDEFAPLAVITARPPRGCMTGNNTTLTLKQTIRFGRLDSTPTPRILPIHLEKIAADPIRKPQLGFLTDSPKRSS